MESEGKLHSNDSVEQTQTTDPRRKDGMGMDFWAASQLKHGLITQEAYDDFVKKNNSKEEQMAQKGLPQVRHYGLFHSISEITEKLSSLTDGRFIIRCTSKETGDIKRLIDTDLLGAIEFAKELPGGFEKWEVEMKEFAETKAAGTIIVQPSGETTIEMWKGPHYLNTTNVTKYHGDFNPDQFHQVFHWEDKEGDKDLPEFKSYAMEALRYFFPHLKPRPGEPVYIEYGVKSDGKLYFIEAIESAVMTGGLLASSPKKI